MVQAPAGREPGGPRLVPALLWSRALPTRLAKPAPRAEGARVQPPRREKEARGQGRQTHESKRLQWERTTSGSGTK